MQQVFDFKNLTNFSKSLLSNAAVTMPKETRQFINKQGFALRKKVREKSKQLVKKRSGKYHKGWRKGKVYYYRGDKTDLAVRVYNGNRHAHLVEYGRRYKKSNGSEYFSPGKHVLESATDEFIPEYLNALDSFMDELIEKI